MFSIDLSEGSRTVPTAVFLQSGGFVDQIKLLPG